MNFLNSYNEELEEEIGREEDEATTLSFYQDFWQIPRFFEAIYVAFHPILILIFIKSME